MLCQYCGQDAAFLKPGDEDYPYPADWGPAWKCTPCDAYIRCYKGGDKPLGSLANAETREWRSRAHKALDSLWKSGEMWRSEAYVWLAEALGIHEDEAHIGRMDPEQCKRVIDLVKQRAQQRHAGEEKGA